MFPIRRSLLAAILRPQVTLRTSSSDTKDKWLPFEKKQYVRRSGYEPKIHVAGPLPRIPNDPGPLKGILYEEPKDFWHPKEALFGQNDYIDILGDGSIHPAKLLTNVPWWLRGWRGHEIQMLNRKRLARPNLKNTRPDQYLKMFNRVHHLYLFMNKHKMPPRPVRYR